MATSHAKSKKIPNPDEIKEIIKETMEKEEVKPRLVPYEGSKLSFHTVHKSRRYFEICGFAWFKCQNGDNNWPSSRAWCIIDLKFIKICYRYCQKCKYCNAEARPKFPKDIVQKMAQYAVDTYLKRSGLKNFHERLEVTTRNIKGKHDEERCEKCQKSGRPCIPSNLKNP